MSTSKKVQSIKIYALIHEHNVFIGKTQGDITPVYYRHRRAENPFTEKFFYPKNSKNPSIHVLECIRCNFHEGYRHIVVWVRIFQDAGYEIINTRGTVEDANDLHPQTKDLVYRLRPISLETFLKETQHKKQNKSISVDTLELPEREQAIEAQSRQKITLWATQEEKKSFIS